MKARCPKCGKEFDTNLHNLKEEIYIISCPECHSRLRLTEQKDVLIATDATTDDVFWIGLGERLVKNRIIRLNEIAKYLMVICVSLIIIHFGLLLIFRVQASLLDITPELLFTAAAAAFSISLIIPLIGGDLRSLNRIKDVYLLHTKWNVVICSIGISCFVAGLLFMIINLVITNVETGCPLVTSGRDDVKQEGMPFIKPVVMPAPTPCPPSSK